MLIVLKIESGLVCISYVGQSIMLIALKIESGLCELQKARAVLISS